eukprot:6468614-Pyramimonas_sp.AAC.1
MCANTELDRGLPCPHESIENLKNGLKRAADVEHGPSKRSKVQRVYAGEVLEPLWRMRQFRMDPGGTLNLGVCVLSSLK